LLKVVFIIKNIIF